MTVYLLPPGWDASPLQGYHRYKMIGHGKKVKFYGFFRVKFAGNISLFCGKFVEIFGAKFAEKQLEKNG